MRSPSTDWHNRCNNIGFNDCLRIRYMQFSIDLPLLYLCFCFCYNRVLSDAWILMKSGFRICRFRDMMFRNVRNFLLNSDTHSLKTTTYPISANAHLSVTLRQAIPSMTCWWRGSPNDIKSCAIFYEILDSGPWKCFPYIVKLLRRLSSLRSSFLGYRACRSLRNLRSFWKSPQTPEEFKELEELLSRVKSR